MTEIQRNVTILLPESWHQYNFRKTVDELDRVAYVDKDRARRRLQA